MLSREDVISAADMALPLQREQGGNQSGRGGISARDDLTLDAAEKMLIENALRITHHNVSEAARHLGITRMAIRYRMSKHGIKLS